MYLSSVFCFCNYIYCLCVCLILGYCLTIVLLSSLTIKMTYKRIRGRGNYIMLTHNTSVEMTSKALDHNVVVIVLTKGSLLGAIKTSQQKSSSVD